MNFLILNNENNYDNSFIMLLFDHLSIYFAKISTVKMIRKQTINELSIYLIIYLVNGYRPLNVESKQSILIIV